MKIAYLDGSRLRRALIAGCEQARNARLELNRINVFPVPDGDTGTNLAKPPPSARGCSRMNRAGKVEPADKVKGAKALLPTVMDMITEAIGSARDFRFGVVHVDAEDVAERVRTGLLERFGAREVLISPATPVIATHLGRGAWGVAYQVED